VSFTRQFVVTDEQALKANWCCIGPKAFFCAFCLHQFELGDEYRMVYTNDIPKCGGNPLTCKSCWDNNGGLEGLRTKWRELWAEYNALMAGKFKWWGMR